MSILIHWAIYSNEFLLPEKSAQIATILVLLTNKTKGMIWREWGMLTILSNWAHIYMESFHKLCQSFLKGLIL